MAKAPSRGPRRESGRKTARAPATGRRTGGVASTRPAASYASLVEGMPARAVRTYIEEGRLKETDVASVVPKRTFERRLANDQTLKLAEADAIVRLVRVRDHARSAFDDGEQAEIWLDTPNPALGGEVPIRMARTDLGAREVEAVLTRFEHGVFG